MKELVLTGLKELWPEDDKNVVFLGPWCFANNHKYKFWDQRNFTLASSPWKTPQDILNASLYIDSLIDRIIPPFSILMNNFHKVNYSERFWKIYSIVWLTHWLGHCYDRYQRLNYLPQTVNKRLTVKIIGSRELYVKDFWDYMKKIMEEHFYNLMLMSDIIQASQFEFLEPEVVNIQSNINEKDNFQKSIIGRRTKTNILKKLVGLVKPIIKRTIDNCLSSTIHLGDIYGVSSIDKLYLQFYYDPSFLFKKGVNDNLTAIEGNRSDLIKRSFEFNEQNEFEKIVKKIILYYIPDKLLTIYSRPKNNKTKVKVWIGKDIYTSEKYAYRIAEICEHGRRWISAQHGGGYGQFFSFPLGKIEYESSEGFITWGWNFSHFYLSNYYPLPSPMLSKLPKHKEKKEQIIFVSTMHPAYYYRLSSCLKPEDLINYLENKEYFLIKLSDNIRSKIRYRPYFKDYGTGELEFVSRVLNPHRFIVKKNLIKHFRNSALVVIDHLATSFLESFAMNTPTILFWNPEHFVVASQVAPYFDKLRTAGILFNTPEAAAEKVNEIWNDVQGWWQQQEVQEAKNDFCWQFARTSKNWRKEWRDFLKTLK